MKKSFVNLLVISLISISCSDRQNGIESQTELSEEVAKILNPQVGGPIAVTTAQAWTKAYSDHYASQGTAQSFFADAETLKKNLSETYNGLPIDGISFTKGVNETGVEVMITIPVQNGKMLKMPEAIYELGESGTSISMNADVAESFSNRYADRHPSNNITKSYFIGRETLLEILSFSNDNKLVDGIRLIKAIKENGMETLVYIPTQNGNDLWHRSKQGVNARTQGNESSYDFSAPCPPTCP